MSASVTVGFAPAAVQLIAPGTATAAAPEADAGDPSLFAALLALLGPQLPAAPTATADGTADTPVLPVPDTKPIATLDIIDLPHAAEALKTDAGKSLLKDLGKALIAANDALADGQPISPALEKELRETLDDLAALIGIAAPPPPPVNPVITAAASGEAILPTAESAPPTPATTQPELPDPGIPPVDSAASIAPVATTAPAGAEAPSPAPATGAAEITPAAAMAGIAEVTIPGPSIGAADIQTPAPAESSAALPPITQLATLIEDLGTRLKQQAPELAQKLDALAQKLAAADLPADLLEKLGLSRAAGEPDSDLTKLVETLAAPRPVKDPAPAPAFQVPALKLPEPSTATTRAKPEAPTASEAVDTAAAAATDPGLDRAADPAKPVLTVRIAKDTPPADSAPISTAPAAAAASTAPAVVANDPASTPDTTTPAAQVAAAPAVVGARAIHAAYQAPVQQINLPQVAFEVARQVQAGNSRFQIRLDPPELGRIDVRLDVDKHGTVNARMTVERPETLDLMQRDQRALQQALQQAGLDGAKTSLEFSLRQNPFARDGNGGGNQPGFGPFGDASPVETVADASPVSLYRGTASAGGVNLFV